MTTSTEIEFKPRSYSLYNNYNNSKTEPVRLVVILEDDSTLSFTLETVALPKKGIQDPHEWADGQTVIPFGSRID